VRLIFTAHTVEQASEFTDLIIDQLKAGAVNLTLMGKVSKITEE
jgi:hypothetical protein